MDDAAYMKRALRLAKRGEGYVEPNPMVGCVIVKGGAIVGEGWHRRYGGPHAEVEALRKAGGEANGATVYVTLEPCCRHGKTPPCTRALIEAQVKRVVYAAADPTQGGLRGVAELTDAGVEAVAGPCEQEARDLIAPFLMRSMNGRPWVIAKWAATLDGAIATRDGDSRWISNECSRRVVHLWRGRVDAVMVGIGTALADDPLLTARDAPLRRVARRVVLDPSLRLPRDGRLMRSLDKAPLSVATRTPTDRDHEAACRAMEAAGVEVVSLPDLSGQVSGRLDLAPLLRRLAENHQATNLLVEGGGGVIGSLHDQALIDEWRVFIAPKVLGDAKAIRPVQTSGIAGAPGDILEAASLRLIELRRIGHDVLLRYREPLTGS